MLAFVGVLMVTGSTIGERVKIARERLGWSQRKLGALAKTSGSYINQLESGVMPRPGATILRRIAEVMHLDMGELLDDSYSLVLHEELVPYSPTTSLEAQHDVSGDVQRKAMLDIYDGLDAEGQRKLLEDGRWIAEFMKPREEQEEG